MRLEKGEIEAAIEDLTREIEGDPGAISFIELRGDAYAAQGKFDRALTDYRNSIELEQQVRPLLIIQARENHTVESCLQKNSTLWQELQLAKRWISIINQNLKLMQLF